MISICLFSELCMHSTHILFAALMHTGKVWQYAVDFFLTTTSKDFCFGNHSMSPPLMSVTLQSVQILQSYIKSFLVLIFNYLILKWFMIGLM